MMDKENGGDVRHLERQGLVWDVFLAASVLTRLPLPHLMKDGHVDVLRAVWAYPLLGAIVGALAGLIFMIVTAAGLGAGAGIVAAVAAMILVTGAMHEDGFADFCDGAGGGTSRDDKLQIMRDSHIGVYGVAGLVIALLLQVECLRDIAATVPDIATRSFRMMTVLIAAGAMSRAAIVVVLATMESVRTDGLTATGKKPGALRLAVALLLGITISCVTVGVWTGLAIVAGCLIGSGLIALIAHRMFGGYSGDILGAAIVVAFTLGLCAAVVAGTGS